MKKRFKKFFRKIFFLILVIAVAIFLIIKLWPKEPLVKREVSQRAQEYIKPEAEAPKDGQLITTKCFDVKMPVFVRNPLQENTDLKCVVRATLDEPHTFITVSVEHLPNLTSLKDYSAIKLRLMESDKYFEENFKGKKSLNTKVFSTNDEITYFSLENSKLVIVSLHDLIRFDDQTYELLEKIVESTVVK